MEVTEKKPWLRRVKIGAHYPQPSDQIHIWVGDTNKEVGLGSIEEHLANYRKSVLEVQQVRILEDRLREAERLSRLNEAKVASEQDTNDILRKECREKQAKIEKLIVDNRSLEQRVLTSGTVMLSGGVSQDRYDELSRYNAKLQTNIKALESLVRSKTELKQRFEAKSEELGRDLEDANSKIATLEANVVGLKSLAERLTRERDEAISDRDEALIDSGVIKEDGVIEDQPHPPSSHDIVSDESFDAIAGLICTQKSLVLRCKELSAKLKHAESLLSERDDSAGSSLSARLLRVEQRLIEMQFSPKGRDEEGEH